MLQRFLLLIFLQSFVFAIIKVNPANQFFIDEHGRVRLFHGVNAVYKLPPWHPQTTGFDPQLSLSQTDIANLKAWGFNVVRLGMMWPGVEPTRGNYDSSYVSVMAGIVDALAKEGIYTILDAHQDVYNRKFCGEGFPDWTVVEEGVLPFALPYPGVVPTDPTLGFPNITECLKNLFGKYYFSDKVSAAFQNFYDDVQGIQSSFGGFWTYVANAFKDNDYVLGYELINEPWAGNIYTNPGLLTPGEADRVNLQPLYEMLHTKIRQVDNEHILFFEQSLVSVTPPNGFSQGPGGPSYNDRQAFAYHIYCAPTDSNGDPTNVVECDLVDTIFYAEAERNLKRLGCGGFMTEFGAMGNSSNAVENLAYLTGAADTFLQSWTYWQFKLFDDITTAGPAESFYINSQLETAKVKALSRTYAQAVAGIPIRTSFNPLTSEFLLDFAINTTITAPGLIYLNQEWYYPRGFQVEISPPGLIKWFQVDKNAIQLHNLPTAPNGSRALVKISQA